MQMTATVDVDLGELLGLWRRQAGMKLVLAKEKVNSLLPPQMAVSTEMIRRYEAGSFPARGPDPILVAALALGYGRKTTELPVEMQEALLPLDRLTRNR